MHRRKIINRSIQYLLQTSIQKPLLYNLSLFASMSSSQHGEDLPQLVRKHLDEYSVSDQKAVMEEILTLVLSTIVEMGVFYVVLIANLCLTVAC